MIEVYTDGASAGNPGFSGAGIYIKSNQQIFEYSIPLGFMSNHEAEFRAIIEALTICKQDFPKQILSFKTDSKIAVDVIEKNHTKNNIFRPLLKQINNDIKLFPHFFIKWIPAKINIHADYLARNALKQQISNP